jgi:tRNA-dihydrouridine synthase A
MEKQPPKFTLEENSVKCSESELHKISIAPMIDVTDRNFRVLFRMFSRKVTLYTEMIHCDTILNSVYTDDKLRLLPIEKPVILQLGGCDPEKLAKAAKIGEEYGYDEINLNCGCPSPRVTKGSFGACLMKEPELVAECVRHMEKVVKIPVTVKCRLGVDDQDDYEFLYKFMDELKQKTNCKHVIIHARKAFLKGLNPKQNRNIPPLIYERVYRAAKEFPGIKVSINGGIRTLEHAKQILDENPTLLGVMMGRAAYQTPWIFGDLDRFVYNSENPSLSRKEILRKYAEFADYILTTKKSYKIPTMVRPILGLFAREKGFKVMKRFLSEKKNYVNEKSFCSFIEKLLIQMESINPDALNEKYDKEGIIKMQKRKVEMELRKQERIKRKMLEKKKKEEEDKQEKEVKEITGNTMFLEKKEMKMEECNTPTKKVKTSSN